MRQIKIFADEMYKRKKRERNEFILAVRYGVWADEKQLKKLF
ncbi:hypothetical protein [Persephonella sp.]